MSDIQKPKQETIARWKNAIAGVEQCKSYLNRAEVELSNSLVELGRSMVPKDASVGESFSVWVSDRLLVVTLVSAGEYKANWRE